MDNFDVTLYDLLDKTDLGQPDPNLDQAIDTIMDGMMFDGGLETTNTDFPVQSFALDIDDILRQADLDLPAPLHSIGLQNGTITDAANASEHETKVELWERHRLTITQLYINQDRPLKEVMGIMERDYGHRGSIKTYKKRFRRVEP